MIDSGPMRCERCGGSGEIPVIAGDCWIHPDRPPTLECCPDCVGTGLIRDGYVLQAPPQRRARKVR